MYASWTVLSFNFQAVDSNLKNHLETTSADFFMSAFFSKLKNTLKVAATVLFANARHLILTR